MTLAVLNEKIENCRRCPRMVKHLARLREKHPGGWCRPVGGCGPDSAWLLVVGLAPGARGAGFTGVAFTRDHSGLYLRGALERVGIDAGREVYFSNAARCVPPENRPTPAELKRCAGFLAAEWELLKEVKVVLCLGAVAWRAAGKLGGLGATPAFGHGVEAKPKGILGEARILLASYHVSPLNTQTGRLTVAGFEAVLRRARELAGRPVS